MSRENSSNEPENGKIQTISLTMVYKTGRTEVPALRDVNLTVNPGEFVAIMGPSGCGKSTLLHLLGGLAQPSGGSILIDGIDIAKLSDAERTAVRRKKIGYVFQRFNLLPSITARANIELAKQIHGNGHMNRNGSEEIIEMLGIRDKMPFRPTELSGGEQQRVAIARAVINHPSIILADEPTGSLDSRNSRLVLRLLQDLNERYRQSIVMITHDADAASMANRVIEMRDGQVLGKAAHFSYEPEFEGLF
jgi:putative ABC transport system ATP-binding protein